MLWESTDRQRVSEALQAVEPHLRRAPFIASALDACGVTPGTLDADALTRVRPARKRDFRATSYVERSVETESGRLVLGSSGTSGPPTLYCWTAEDLRHVGAVTRPLRAALGVTRDDVGAVWAPTDRSVMGQAMVAEFLAEGCCVHLLGAADPRTALQELIAGGATIVKGLPGPLSSLATLADGHIEVRQAHVGGDLLSAARRAAIERGLECDCYNFYGLSEVYGPLAAECTEKDGMHFLDGDVLIEVLDPDTLLPVTPGSLGIAVFTSLWPKTSPVLRYWSDDVFEVMPRPCRCGNPMLPLRYHGRYVGPAYDRRVPLSLLRIEATVDQFVGGVGAYDLVLGQEKAALSLLATGEVDPGGLARELSTYLGTTVDVDVDASRPPRPKIGSVSSSRPLPESDAPE